MSVRFRTGLLALGLAFPLGLGAQEGDPPAGAQAADSAAAAADVQPAPGEARAATPPPQEPPRVGDPRLVFEREVFAYPAFGRRNPFRSLVAEGSGPRFEQMRLEMIIHSENPARSMALLSAGRRGAAPAQQGAPAGQSERLRVGDRWGNVRIVAIRPTQVVVEVEEFGLTEQRIMELPTRGQGGSR